MSKPIGYTITLLRTGGTSWDAEERFTGQTDLPMTDQGSDEVARAVHAGTFEHPFSVILTSDEEACVSSAKMLPHGPDTKIKKNSKLKNISLGLWEGVLESDLKDRNPSCYSQWSEHPERITPPEGESLAEGLDRLLAAIDRSLSKCKGSNPNIAIVLRPLSWAVVRSWLSDQKLGTIWTQLEEPIAVEHFELAKSELTQHKQSSKASA